MSEGIDVIKLNVERAETWRYHGKVLRRGANEILLEALFNRADMPFHGVVLGRGDRFVEMFFSERWYNIFEIHDRHDDVLKAWYCNVSLPAQFSPGQVAYVDLALDLFIYPDGRQLVLDEDEFADLAIDDQTREKARAALVELQAIFHSRSSFRLE